MPLQHRTAFHESQLSEGRWPYRFRILRQLGQILSTAAPTDFKQACKELSAEAGSWVTLDLFSENGELERTVEASEGKVSRRPCPPLDADYFQATLLPIDSVQTFTTTAKGATWFLRPRKSAIDRTGEQTIVAAPLLFGGQCLGLLSLGWPTPMPAAWQDLDFLAEIARLFSFAAEMKRLRQETVQIRQMRDEMLNVVSHDLKNPLTAMLVSASLIEERAQKMNSEQGGRFKKLSGSIRRSAERMNGMLSDLLDIVRAEAGRLNFEAKPVEFFALLQEALRSTLPLAEQRAVSLIFTGAPAKQLSWVSGDPERLLRVIFNLLACALQATPAGGVVRVALSLRRVSAKKPELVFEVIDGGMMLNEAQRTSMFNAMWPANGQPKGQAGLSLTASKGIVERHGGRLELIPREDGNCLRCILPLTESSQQSQVPA